VSNSAKNCVLALPPDALLCVARHQGRQAHKHTKKKSSLGAAGDTRGGRKDD